MSLLMLCFRLVSRVVWSGSFLSSPMPPSSTLSGDRGDRDRLCGGGGGPGGREAFVAFWPGAALEA
eukprot:711059-Pyramimonas_sp.AAC.1